MIKVGDRFKIKGLELTIHTMTEAITVLKYRKDNMTHFKMVKTAGLIKVLASYKVLKLSA